MNNDYNLPTETYRFEVTFEYVVQAYNMKQAYEMLDNLNITTGISGTGRVHLGRYSPKQMRGVMKRTTQGDFNERPYYYSNAIGICKNEARIVMNKNNWRKYHQRIKYIGKADSELELPNYENDYEVSA